jgi:hypothetical protein
MSSTGTPLAEAAEDGDALIRLIRANDLTGEEDDDELTEEGPVGEDEESDAGGS